MRVASGQYLPADDPRAARAFAVLGARAASELFGAENPARRTRAGGRRALSRRRRDGIEGPGARLRPGPDTVVGIPVARAIEMFNRESLMEIRVLYDPMAPIAEVEEEIKRVLVARHGAEDFTVTPQQEMLEVFDTVLNAITFAIVAIGAISLLVGSIGILTILTIAVAERTGEIGLLRAVGATRRAILALFLGEAALLAAIGGAAGLALGLGVAGLLKLVLPALPVHTPWSYVVLAEVLAVAVGIAAGMLPARRAAHLDPLEALRSE